MNFKSFLNTLMESKDSYIKSIDRDTAIKLIKANCDIDNHLYRGYDSSAYNSKDDYFSITPNKGTRSSRNTTNHYTVILDSILTQQNKPLRSKSIICSTSVTTASSYGELYVILPYKGSTVGCVESSDIWNTDITINKITYSIIEWNKLFEAIGVPDDSLNSISNYINKLINDYVIGVTQSIQSYHEEEHGDDDYMVTEIDILDYTTDIYYNLTSKLDKGVDISDEIDKYEYNAALYYIFGNNKDGVLPILLDAYNPKKIGFDFFDMKEIHKYHGTDTEMWISDKCIAVKESLYKELKKELK